MAMELGQPGLKTLYLMQIAGPEEVKEQYKEYLGRILGNY